jgi:hypothetical protein
VPRWQQARCLGREGVGRVRTELVFKRRCFRGEEGGAEGALLDAARAHELTRGQQLVALGGC